MLIKIYNIELENELVTVFPEGNHVIGRGPVLKCQDKRISRMHARIEVTKDNATITAVHVNPCFFMAANSKTVTILKQNSTTPLQDGDKFGLLPDMFWFKVQLADDDDQITSECIPNIQPNLTHDTSNMQNAMKRSPSASEENTFKRAKFEIESSPSFSKNMLMNNSEAVDQIEDNDVKHECSSSQIPKSVAEPCLENDAKNNLKIETGQDNYLPEAMKPDDSINNETDNKEEQTNGSAVPKKISENYGYEEEKGNVPEITDKSKEPNDQGASESGAKDGTETEMKTNNTENNIPSTSGDGTSKQRREKCWYGAMCYRKNPVHRFDYTHPGDSDYESDPNDDHPTCPYGAKCYRKNKDHRKEYKHPSAPPPKKRVRTKDPHRNENDLSDFEDSDDPFIASGSSDEFTIETDSEDTDWEDSQKVEENSEDMKQLLKEARRFKKR